MKGKFTKIVGDIILPAGFFMIFGFVGGYETGSMDMIRMSAGMAGSLAAVYIGYKLQ